MQLRSELTEAIAASELLIVEKTLLSNQLDDMRNILEKNACDAESLKLSLKSEFDQKIAAYEVDLAEKLRAQAADHDVVVFIYLKLVHVVLWK